MLPYLEVMKNEYEETNTIIVPNVIGTTLPEAKKLLKETGLEYEIKSTTEEYNVENAVILDQLPKQGISVREGTKMILYLD